MSLCSVTINNQSLFIFDIISAYDNGSGTPTLQTTTLAGLTISSLDHTWENQYLYYFTMQLNVNSPIYFPGTYDFSVNETNCAISLQNAPRQLMVPILQISGSSITINNYCENFTITNNNSQSAQLELNYGTTLIFTEIIPGNSSVTTCLPFTEKNFTIYDATIETTNNQTRCQIQILPGGASQSFNYGPLNLIACPNFTMSNHVIAFG